MLFNAGGSAKSLLQIINERNAARGKGAAPRADLRFGTGPDNQVFLLNKQDGTIRALEK